MTDHTIQQIMELRHINKAWKKMTYTDRISVWRNYHKFPKERNPANEYILDRWWACLEDSEKLKRYSRWDE